MRVDRKTGGRAAARASFITDQLSPINFAPSLVTFALDDLAFALALEAVEKVVRVVEITPLSSSPGGVLGIISLAGKIVPVLDLRALFGIPTRSPRITDHLAIVRTSRRQLALLVDAPAEVTAPASAEITPVDSAFSLKPSLCGFVQLARGIVLIHDLERFLSPEEESALDAALAMEAQ